MKPTRPSSDYADKFRLSEEELSELQKGNPIVVSYSSPVDLMIGQYDTVEVLILPPNTEENPCNRVN